MRRPLRSGDLERSLTAWRSACDFSGRGLSDTHCTAYAYGWNGTATSTTSTVGVAVRVAHLAWRLHRRSIRMRRVLEAHRFFAGCKRTL